MKRSLIAAALALAVVLCPGQARATPKPEQPSFFYRLFHPTPATPLRPRHHGAGVVQSGMPAECRGIGAWCGCWLRLRFGITNTRYNLARAWATLGSDAGGAVVGAVAVWRHHVGVITGVPGPGRIILLSGNDGHAVRERERSTRGVIAYRKI